jgi:TIR domain
LEQSLTTQNVVPCDLRQPARNVVFISKATPGDDEFVLWLAPRLEAAGYIVFADILNLEGGTRWRREVTNTLQTRGIKMLLCCQDSTLAREGVQDEIGIAGDLVKELNDPKFIIPLRLEPYKKLFGIGELQWVDFVRGWVILLAHFSIAFGVINEASTATCGFNVFHPPSKRKLAIAHVGNLSPADGSYITPEPAERQAA